MTAWTIGHSTRTLADFIDALRSQRIESLADVRALPGSRRYPHFDQEKLAQALGREGVAYEHFPDLGGRRKPQPDSRNLAWRNAAFRGYADYMEHTGIRARHEAARDFGERAANRDHVRRSRMVALPSLANFGPPEGVGLDSYPHP